VAAELKMPDALAALDLKTADKTKPLGLSDPNMMAALKKLPPDWLGKIAPQQLADGFAGKFPLAPVKPTADQIKSGPLYQVLMIEAQLHGKNGGFGPLGSALLRKSILHSIERVVLAEESNATKDLKKPATMLELINLVREGDENG
jgi:hypothetical protein